MSLTAKPTSTSSDKNQRGTWTPDEIKMDPDLTYFEKFLLSDIYALTDNPTGCCYASNDYLAKKNCTTAETVRVAIWKLIKMGYLNRISESPERMLVVPVLEAKRPVCVDRDAVAITTPLVAIATGDSVAIATPLNTTQTIGGEDVNLGFSPGIVQKYNSTEESTEEKKVQKKENQEKTEELKLVQEQLPGTEKTETIEELLYRTYPHRVGKVRALTVIRRVLKKKRVPPQKLLDLTRGYADLWKGHDLTFCPHPSTWFGNEYFLEPLEAHGPKDKKITPKANSAPNWAIYNRAKEELEAIRAECATASDDVRAKYRPRYNELKKLISDFEASNKPLAHV